MMDDLHGKSAASSLISQAQKDSWQLGHGRTTSKKKKSVQDPLQNPLSLSIFSPLSEFFLGTLLFDPGHTAGTELVSS